MTKERVKSREREKFERTMTALFQAPKAVVMEKIKKKPKKDKY